MRKKLLTIVILIGVLCGCDQVESVEIPPREAVIPASAEKITPENDLVPPVSLSDEFEQPISLSEPINTAGFEDSAFILPDGQTLYFFFTPDASVDLVLQAQDLVTGIYVTQRIDGDWTEPERVWLIEPGAAVMDGCEFVNNDTLWFCTVREGFTGLHWFTAKWIDGKWTNWQKSDFPAEYDVGEFQIHGNQLFYHSSRQGGRGGLDIWMLTMGVDGEWGNPVNVSAVNTEQDEGWPAISPDGTELWISRDFGLWRSLWVDGTWSEPELMISPLAGEATIDAEGHVYFTHHFYDESGEILLDADIYVAYRRSETSE